MGKIRRSGGICTYHLTKNLKILDESQLNSLKIRSQLCVAFTVRNGTFEFFSGFRVLSIMPKVPEILVGSQMERSVSVSSDRNIRDHLWRWSTLTEYCLLRPVAPNGA